MTPWQAPVGWRERIGIVLQESEAEPGLTVRECLDAVRRLLPRSAPSMRRSRWSG